MRTLLAILGAVGAVIVILGAVNHAADVRIDYLLGTSAPFSFFWLAVGIAVAIVVAGLAGTIIGVSLGGRGRRKLEAELDDTYRRLRAAQGAQPEDAQRPALRVVEAPVAAEAATAVSPPEAEAPTAAGRVAGEASTVAEPAAAPPDTLARPPFPDEETVISSEPVEAGTVVTPAPPETQTAVTPAPDEGPDESPAG